MASQVPGRRNGRAGRRAASSGLRRRALIGAGALAFVLTTGAGCGGGIGGGSEIINMKLAHVNPPGNLVSIAAEEFARRINEELAGRVHVDVFGGGSLGSDEVTMVKAKLGTVDIVVASTVVSSLIQEFGFFEIPYLIKDRAHLARVEQEVFWPHIAPYAENLGFKILAIWEHGFRQITNNARPIVRPEDLAGIKLRTPSGYWRINAFQALGAHPTPMPLTEVFVALQTGVIDGQENPMHQIYASRFQEVQKYLSLSNHVYSPVYVVVGLDRWESQPPEVRETIERIARETQAYALAEAERMDSEFLRLFEEAGMEINEVDREAFVRASAPVYDEFGAAVPGGRMWIDMALALAEEEPPQPDAAPAEVSIDDAEQPPEEHGSQ